MAQDDGYIITPELVKQWETTVADLQRKIAAAKVFLPANAAPKKANGDDASMNFMGAIRRLANAATKPIPKPELKEMLRKEGFPESQVGGTYFYLAIKKLKDKEYVSVQADGGIWRGQKRF